MKEYAILVAGGKGSRMQSDTPKQFLQLKGVPVIVHTVRAFLDYNPAISIVIVLPADHKATGQAIISDYFPGLEASFQFCTGGATRFQSVHRGLGMIGDEGCVAVHDAVRPLVDPSDIQSTFELAKKEGSGVLVTEVKESLRKVDEDSSVSVPRALYRSVQTPQTFLIALLKEAYKQQEIPEFTDDASVFERAGHAISLVPGSYRNIKITTPEDLLTAEVMIK